MKWRDLPVGIRDLDELAALLNERFRDDEAQTWDAAGSRITNVGAPASPSDALNLAQADRRYLKIGWQPVIPPQTGSGSSAVSTPGSSGSGSVAVKEVAQGTGTMTVTHPNGSANAVLVVAIQQNSSGDGAIAWGSNFRATTPTDVTPYPSKWSMFTFAWIASEWVLACAPYLET